MQRGPRDGQRHECRLRPRASYSTKCGQRLFSQCGVGAKNVVLIDLGWAGVSTETKGSVLEVEKERRGGLANFRPLWTVPNIGRN